MKPRNSCRICGASGRIRIPREGHFSLREMSTGIMRTRKIKGPTVIACPHCREDKYHPTEATRKPKRKEYEKIHEGIF